MAKAICDDEFPWCTAAGSKGELFKLRLNDLAPTQFAVGRAEVQVRTGRMNKKLKDEPGRLYTTTFGCSTSQGGWR